MPAFVGTRCYRFADASANLVEPLTNLMKQSFLQVMTKYTRMFQYLFRLERMQLELKRCWTSMSEQTRQTGRGKAVLSSLAVPAGMPSLWQVRTHMAHVISNLQLYIQVILPQISTH